MEKIYIRKKGSVITGPYVVEQLQNRLKSSDQVWYEGLSEWQPAQKVEFLRRYISSSSVFSRFLGVR